MFPRSVPREASRHRRKACEYCRSSIADFARVKPDRQPAARGKARGQRDQVMWNRTLSKVFHVSQVVPDEPCGFVERRVRLSVEPDDKRGNRALGAVPHPLRAAPSAVTHGLRRFVVEFAVLEWVGLLDAERSRVTKLRSPWVVVWMVRYPTSVRHPDQCTCESCGSCESDGTVQQIPVIQLQGWCEPL